MDYSIPIPIREITSGIAKGDLECLCKSCKPAITYDHMHCWVWHICWLCKKRVWFNVAKCTLYSWRIGKAMICFNCRIPYYEQGMSNGDIYRMVLREDSQQDDSHKV